MKFQHKSSSKRRRKSSSKRRLEKSALGSSLLRQFERLTRESARIEAQLVDLRAQLCAPKYGATSRDAGPTRRPRPLAQSVDLVRDTLRALQQAGTPLRCGEVAHRLGVVRHVAQYRLDRAVVLKLVEKIDDGRYRVVDVVPEISA